MSSVLKTPNKQSSIINNKSPVTQILKVTYPSNSNNNNIDNISKNNHQTINDHQTIQSLCSCDADREIDFKQIRPLYQYSLDRKKRLHTYTCEQNVQILIRLEREQQMKLLHANKLQSLKDKENSNYKFDKSSRNHSENSVIANVEYSCIDLLSPPPRPQSSLRSRPSLAQTHLTYNINDNKSMQKQNYEDSITKLKESASNEIPSSKNDSTLLKRTKSQTNDFNDSQLLWNHNLKSTTKQKLKSFIDENYQSNDNKKKITMDNKKSIKRNILNRNHQRALQRKKSHSLKSTNKFVGDKCKNCLNNKINIDYDSSSSSSITSSLQRTTNGNYKIVQQQSQHQSNHPQNINGKIIQSANNIPYTSNQQFNNIPYSNEFLQSYYANENNNNNNNSCSFQNLSPIVLLRDDNNYINNNDMIISGPDENYFKQPSYVNDNTIIDYDVVENDDDDEEMFRSITTNNTMLDYCCDGYDNKECNYSDAAGKMIINQDDFMNIDDCGECQDNYNYLKNNNLSWEPHQFSSNSISNSSGMSFKKWDLKRHWLAVLSILLIAGAAGVAVPLALRVTAGAPFEERLQLARQLLNSVPLIDGHNDLPWNIRQFIHNKLNNFNFNSNLKNVQPWSKSKWSHTDLIRMKKGQISAQFWAAYVPCETKFTEAVRMTLEQIDVIFRLTEKYSPQLITCKSVTDIIKAHENHQLCSLTGVEGGHSLGGSLGVLRTYYMLGVRYMTLTSTCHTPWADSSIADAPKYDVKHGGLTAFGKIIIREMNRLGMIVDLSHVSVATMRDALLVSEAPVIFSHSSAYELCNSNRNVPDSILELLVKNRGLVMINFFNKFLTCTENATVNNAIDHINHIKNVAGIDYVGLGSGFDGINHVPIGLEDVSTYPFLFAELLGNGWTIEELTKLAGENFLRVLKAVEEIRDKKKLNGVQPFEDILQIRGGVGDADPSSIFNNCTHLHSEH